jgi:hypothetical protein
MLLQLDPQDLRLVRRKPVRRNAEISGKNLALAGDDSAVALGAWEPMAVAIMGGLIVAMALNPVIFAGAYAVWSVRKLAQD